METTRSNSGPDVILDAGRTFFHRKRDQFHAAISRYKVYRTTCFELSSLGDRDLKDLGIPRSSIKSIAWEAANGR